MATGGVDVVGGNLVVLGGPECLQCPLESLAGRNYCGRCGRRLRRSFEDKQVSVLFVDVSGFTTLSERLNPEQVSEIMRRTFDILLGAVHEHGGTVNQLLGDGVIALFGERQSAHHARSALSAALAVREDLETLRHEVRRRYGLEFRVRMAINSGPVILGTIGAALRTDHTATGSTTSVASRLLCSAEFGQIVLSDRTRVLAAGRYGFQKLGEVSATGSSERVSVYALISEAMDAESWRQVSV